MSDLERREIDEIERRKKAEFQAALSNLHVSIADPNPAPVIYRRHVDGPYIRRPDGQIHWLTLRERLLTKLRVWNATDIERRLRQ